MATLLCPETTAGRRTIHIVCSESSQEQRQIHAASNRSHLKVIGLAQVGEHSHRARTSSHSVLRLISSILHSFAASVQSLRLNEILHNASGASPTSETSLRPVPRPAFFMANTALAVFAIRCLLPTRRAFTSSQSAKE